MSKEELAKKIADEIFRVFQCGMGTTNHPVVIDPAEKHLLASCIEEVLNNISQ